MIGFGQFICVYGSNSLIIIICVRASVGVCVYVYVCFGQRMFASVGMPGCRQLNAFPYGYTDFALFRSNLSVLWAGLNDYRIRDLVVISAPLAAIAVITIHRLARSIRPEVNSLI